MSDSALPGEISARPAGSAWLARLVASRGFQTWAARFPLTRRLVRREGEAMFDLLAGFCHSQVLSALVQLGTLDRLMQGPLSADALALHARVPPERMQVLLRAGVALGLLRQRRAERFAISRTGAALTGVPGLPQMIAHHDVLYRDLADPVAFFRGEVETELADFWPYVFGGEMDGAQAQTYSQLMADSQRLVAEDTLATVDLSNVQHLMDVGGGSGAFLAEVGVAYPALRLTLFDLPQVAPQAEARFARAGMAERTEIVGGSFREAALPEGADGISLIRVLYDHSDETVKTLLARVFAALPEGGRLIISEPMTGGARPSRAGDGYFALYTMAMRTGRARSAHEIAALCEVAGFADVQTPRARRPFVTSCVVATKPSA
ncbi:methyltransferase domain-containing protein [Sulfitobacter albidus]|uniref:Methyltransferase domain-containing protein n=1 Tax=Sulfitobacter albidus TaxID=2829501 RepID=A0A975JH25_9RHOB|nr:methyltransferase [Sulfitobacter albidus]QUJ78399.1 methyltransferase domain-containing protein [Sulfitobacter albidus]